MDRDQITEMLDQTLADRRLSRGERRALEEAFADLDLSESDRAGIRNLAFERAAEVLSGVETLAVLEWLEDVIRALDKVTWPEHKRAPATSWCSARAMHVCSGSAA